MDCYDIFEILNARGVDLKESELLKNYIFKYSQPKYSVDEAKEKWKIIENNMTECSNNIEQFLIHFTTYKYNKPNSAEGVFRIIKTGVEKTKVKELLDDIVSDSSIYKYFYNTELIANKTIKKCVEYFKMINHRQFRPLLLALFSANKKGLLEDFELETNIVFLKNFYFAFGTVCNKTSNLIENKIYDYAKEIENNFTINTLQNLKSDLLKYYPSEDDFEYQFKEIGFSNKHKLYSNSNNKKIMNYIFYEIENHLKTTSELNCDLQKCSIEHIKPDSPEDSSVCKIGNLLLIDRVINEKMENKSFIEKKCLMEKSELNNVKIFLFNYKDKDEWTDDNIKIRGTKLAKLAYSKIWKV